MVKKFVVNCWYCHKPITDWKHQYKIPTHERCLEQYREDFNNNDERAPSCFMHEEERGH